MMPKIQELTLRGRNQENRLQERLKLALNSDYLILLGSKRYCRENKEQKKHERGLRIN